MNLLETAKKLNITPAGLRHAISTGRTTNAAVAREFKLTLSTGACISVDPNTVGPMRANADGSRRDSLRRVIVDAREESLAWIIGGKHACDCIVITIGIQDSYRFRSIQTTRGQRNF